MIGQTRFVATVRCPECQRKNQVPDDAVAKARCGACRAPLVPSRSRAVEARPQRRPGGSSGSDRLPGIFAPPGPGGGASPGGPGGPGSPWGAGGAPGPASPWGPGGLGGPGSPMGGGGDPSGARMRQARRTPRTASTGRGPSPFGGGSAPPSDPRARLVQQWDQLLRLVPADMGLNAALGERMQGGSSDPISWLSTAADIPRAALEHVRHVRNNVGSNRPVPDRDLSQALETVDRALAMLGHLRLPD